MVSDSSAIVQRCPAVGKQSIDFHRPASEATPSPGRCSSTQIVRLSSGRDEVVGLASKQVKESRTVAWRMAVVLVFLLGMPILALPHVQQRIGEILADRPDLQLEPTAAAKPPLLRVGSPPDSAQERPSEQPLMPGIDEGEAVETQVEQLRQRFTELGATYVLLERVGVEGDRYRFTCHMPVAANSPYREQLQAVATDPIEAMSQVLADLERQPSATSDEPALPRPTVTLRSPTQ